MNSSGKDDQDPKEMNEDAEPNEQDGKGEPQEVDGGVAQNNPKEEPKPAKADTLSLYELQMRKMILASQDPLNG